MKPLVFASPRRARRRPSLTPMIDVVFLLLIFFMLAARFGGGEAAALNGAGTGTGRWQGPPRLVTVALGSVRLNGRELAPEAVVAALRPLMPGPDAPVVLRPRAGATVQELMAIADRLRAAGIRNLVVVE